MSGQDILIEQLRAEVERLESEIAALRKQIASRTEAIQTSLATTRELRERAEKAERNEKSTFAVMRKCEDEIYALRDRADKAEHERDEARAERDEARTVGEAVLSELRDFGWDHAVLRADIESERLAETVEGCVMLAIERAIRAHAAQAVKT